MEKIKKTITIEDNIPARKKHFKFAIEGNIAAGKSTLIEALKKSKPEWNFFQEPVAMWKNVVGGKTLAASVHSRNNLLKMFYDDKQRWSYTFQSYALFSKLHLHRDAIEPLSTVSFYERSYYSDRFIFAESCYEQGYMTETEWSIYKDWCDFLVTALNGDGDDLDGLVYLRVSPQVCTDRRNKRGRAEETGILFDYIQTLHDKHESLFYKRCLRVSEKFKKLPILVIDCNEVDNNSAITKTKVSLVEQFVSKFKFDEVVISDHVFDCQNFDKSETI